MVRCGQHAKAARDTRSHALATIALDGGLVNLLFVLAAAALAGFIDAMAGGGGLIQVPALLAGYPSTAPATLLGTNKLASFLGTSSALARYTRSIDVPWRSLLPAAAVAFPAAVIGASLASAISPAAFRCAVPLILTIVLIYVVGRGELGVTHRPVALPLRRQAAALAAIGAIGLYDGFFGPGTGSFLMLLFIRVYGFDFVNASASARVVNVATNAGALVYFGAFGHVQWPLALALGSCNIAGNLFGAHTALSRGSRFVRRVFIVVVAGLIVKTAWDAYKYLP